MNVILVAETDSGAPATGSPLLNQLWQAARNRGDSQPTADGLVDWARRFILFHNKRHPSQLRLREAAGGTTLRYSEGRAERSVPCAIATRLAKRSPSLCDAGYAHW
jgi:hypothetical protein